jgi:TDG/mug DNA glycosylase family protein
MYDIDDMLKIGLDPIIDSKTAVLILGSLPSDVSLAKGEYYSDPRNDFWKLIGQVVQENLTALPYESKIQALRNRGIGLWDIYHRCTRPGSMDKNISEPELNDFKMLKAACPLLRLLCLNGQKAGEPEEFLRSLGYATMILPSSSGANRTNQVERSHDWNAIRDVACLP